ncbi:MAG: hypothetical protein QME78_00105 [Thermodesulfobacteriota bacterium]|nr:hypothetical protein [Thermodesulfobacteriota bacterium]
MSTALLLAEGRNRILGILFGSTGVDSSLYVGLYRNAARPADNAVLADLSEVSGPGYARRRLYRGSWTVDGSQATYAIQTFLASGGHWGYVTGFFLATTVNNSGKLLAVEHFDNAFNIVDGKGLKVQPQMVLT